jgi:tetratricopeptide (TPR) repeat protein
LQTASYAIPVQNLAEAKNNLTVEVQSAQGKILLHWSPTEPIDGNPDLVASVGTSLRKKVSVNSQTPLEELYLHGVFLEKTGDLQGALKDYNLVLQKDPEYIPALLQEALYHYHAASFQVAEHLVAQALQRDDENPAVAYASGVIYRADGQLTLAKNAFWTSIHYGYALPPGQSLAAPLIELGEIEIRQKNYAQAILLLQRAIACDAGDAFALTDLAVAERLSGDAHKATLSSTEAIEQMRLLPYALAEHWLDENGKTESTSASVAAPGSAPAESWTKTISPDSQNYIAIAAWYHDLGAWRSSDAVLRAAIQNLSAHDLSPMIYYYLASNARQEGNSQQAEQYGQRAASLPIAQVFPNRITDAAVLTEAVHDNPADAHAKYALGNFLFAHGRYDEAAVLWSKASDQGFNNAVLQRNLGVYEGKVKDDLASAAGYYVRAIQLSPNDYRLYTDLDSIYEQQGNTAARTNLFRNAPAEVLDQDTVRARHALFLIEQSEPDQALALLIDHNFKPWEGGVVIHNMFVFANLEKGKNALAEQKPGQAAQAFRQAMQYPENLGTGEPAQPSTAEQLYWLGVTLQMQGNTQEAKSAWQSAAAESQNKIDVSTVFSALAFKKLGQAEQAQQLFKGCILSAAGPEATANDYFIAAMAELYSGNAELARSDFQHALKLDPLLWEARVTFDRMSNSSATSLDH